MASIPCTIIIQSNNDVVLPLEMLETIIKYLFKFGVKNIKTRSNQIFLKLNYTPKADTLKRKFGNLPLKYLKLSVETDREIALLYDAMNKFSFDWKEDDAPGNQIEYESQAEILPIFEPQQQAAIQILDNTQIFPGTSSEQKLQTITIEDYEDFMKDMGKNPMESNKKKGKLIML